MYNTIMWDYIKQESDLLMKQLHMDQCMQVSNNLKEINAIYIVAHGSSYNAGYTVAYYFQNISGVRVYVYTPEEFIHNKSILDLENQSTTLIVGISQTGSSSGVIQALKISKEMYFKVLVVTSVKDSPIGKLGDFLLLLRCGLENSNAKTKGYSLTLLVLLQFAYSLGVLRGKIDKTKFHIFFEKVEKEICNLYVLENKALEWCNKNKFGENLESLYAIGNGVHYGTAMECMLKLMETMCIPTMFSNILEFSHGMHRSVKKGAYIVLIKGKDYQEEVSQTFQYFRRKNIKTLMLDIGGQNQEENIFPIPYYSLTHSLFSVVMIIQILSAYAPEKVGLDPNRNSNNDFTEFMKTRI